VLISQRERWEPAPLDALEARPSEPLRARSGKALGIRDHIAAIEYDEHKVKEVLRLPGYGQTYKGNHITHDYDFWAGKSGNQWDGTRFTLQEILPLDAPHILYDDGRDRRGTVVVGSTEEGALDLQQPHRAPGDDRRHERRRILVPPPSERASARTPVPSGRTFKYDPLRTTLRAREAANSAIADVLAKAGRSLHEVHFPQRKTLRTGGRLPDGGLQRPSVVDHQNEVFGYPGLFCMDSSSIPTSLGVNPSLTISAVAERACNCYRSERRLRFAAKPTGSPRESRRSS